MICIMLNMGEQLQSSLYSNSWFEQNMRKFKKNTEKFSYPHPILKSFSSVSQQSLSFPPYAYQNFHTSDPKSISNKLLRCTHLYPLLGSSFSLLLHPLHPKLEVDSFSDKIMLQCPKCRSYLNSASMHKLSLFRHKCKFCGCLIQSQFQSGRFVDINVLDKILDSTHTNQKIDDEPCFLFVIEASEYLYKKNIVTQIFQCLRALCPPVSTGELNKSTSEETQKETERSCSEEMDYLQTNRIKIGFILFDGERSYMVNMSTMQLVVLNPSHFETVEEFPLTQAELLQPLYSTDLQELEQIINSLMYESYMINASCLLPTLKVCDLLCKAWQVQPKVFALSYDQSMLAQPHKKSEQQKKTRNFEINPRVQLTVFSYGLYEQLTGLGLSKNLSMYRSYNKISETDIYYALYHSLTQQTHYQVEISISTTGLITTTNPVQIIPVLTSNRPIVLDFSVPSKLKQLLSLEGKHELSSQCIQIKLKLQKFERIITYSVPTIGANLCNEPYVLNDETFFYVMLFKFLKDDKLNSVNKAIRFKCKEIVQRIMKSEDEQFSIPKNLINFFMYSFIMVEHRLCEKKNQNFLVEKAAILNEGLETIVKKLYPKVYEFQPEMRAIKFRPKSFLHNTIKLVDDGKSISIVIGDEVPTSVLMQLFGLRNLDDVLELKQIPHLETNLNKKLQMGLGMLKELNELYFLNVKLMKLDSRQFEEEFGNFLYTDDDHRKFFLKLLRD